LAADIDVGAGWCITSRQQSQLSEIINTGEIMEQVEQDEVNGE